MDIKIKFNPTLIDNGRYAIASKAASLVNQYRDLSCDMRGKQFNSKSNEEKFNRLVDECRTIGETAAFFGGYEAMLELNKAIIKAGGDSVSLNWLWEGICGWIP